MANHTLDIICDSTGMEPLVCELEAILESSPAARDAFVEFLDKPAFIAELYPDEIAAVSANEVRFLLKPTESFLELMPTLRALRV